MVTKRTVALRLKQNVRYAHPTNGIGRLWAPRRVHGQTWHFGIRLYAGDVDRCLLPLRQALGSQPIKWRVLTGNDGGAT